MERSIIQEFSTNESLDDTVMGSLLLSHTFAKAIVTLYGKKALEDICDLIRSSVSKRPTPWNDDTLYVLSNQLEAILLSLD